MSTKHNSVSVSPELEYEDIADDAPALDNSHGKAKLSWLLQDHTDFYHIASSQNFNSTGRGSGDHFMDEEAVSKSHKDSSSNSSSCCSSICCCDSHNCCFMRHAPTSRFGQSTYRCLSTLTALVRENWLSFLFGIILIVASVITVAILHRDRNDSEHRFLDREWDDVSDRLQTRMQVNGDFELRLIPVVASWFGVLNATNEMTLEKYGKLTNAVSQQFPSITGFPYMPVVRANDTALRQRLETQGAIDFGADKGFIRNFANQSMDEYVCRIYTPIQFMWPPRLYRLGLLDLNSESTRRVAIEGCIDANSPRSTPPVALFVSDGSAAARGFVVFLPIYAEGANITTTQQRRDAVVAVQGIGHRADTSWLSSVRGIPPGTNVKITDIDTGLTASMIEYDPSVGDIVTVDPTLPRAPATPIRQFTFTYWSRQYRVELYATPLNNVGFSSTENSSLEVLATAVAIVSAVFVFIASTYSARMIARLRRLQFEANEASKAKSDFIGFLCHEIRNPLHGLMAIIAMHETDHTQREDVIEAWTTSRHCTQSIVTILNDVLDVSKLDFGSMELEECTTDIERIVHDVVSIHAPRAHTVDTRVCVDFQAGLPQFFMTDATRLQQVLHNLVGNAVKFTRSGVVIASVREIQLDQLRKYGASNAIENRQAKLSHEVDSADEWLMQFGQASVDRIKHRNPGANAVLLELIVGDTGCGIDSVFFKHIFKAFSQEKTSVTREHGGSGLGLYIVSKLVTLLGGSPVFVKSIVGRGTGFKIFLPLETVDMNGLHSPSDSLIVQVRSAAAAAATAAAATAANSDEKVHEQSAGVSESTPRRISQQNTSGMASSSGLGRGPGSNVHIELPLMPGQCDTISESRPHAPQNVVVVEEEVDLLTTFDVMIVDDVKLNRRILKRMICKSVRSVCECVDGIDVVETMYPPDSSDTVAPPVDIILMDLVMPRMSGIDATMKLRELGFNKPIVAVTANATLQDRSKCIAAGMDDVLPKPFSKKQILDILDRYCITRV
jgi:signal transduction histidine kinase/ActR/RegA family two-component response regulator